MVSELEILDALLLLSRVFELGNVLVADLLPSIPLPLDATPLAVDLAPFVFFFELPSNEDYKHIVLTS